MLRRSAGSSCSSPASRSRFPVALLHGPPRPKQLCSSMHRRSLACCAVRTLAGPCIVQIHSNTRSTGTPSMAFPQTPSNSLALYMAEVAERFAGMELPLGGKLTNVPDQPGRVELTVPRIQMFDVWVQPRVITTVKTFPDRIEVTSNTEDCQITGSHHVQELHLDERYNLDVCLTFTWDSTPAAKQPPAIHVDTRFNLDIDIPAPFSLIPVPVLTATGDAAFGAVLPVIVGAFVNKLAEDYVQWARLKAGARF